VDLFAPAALSPGPLADTPIRSLHADFDNVWARGESSPMKVKRHGLVVILLFISITLVTGCTYLLTMPAANPHSEYDGPRPWATPWKSPTPQ
jgi:hypothetical protein